jgi:hypothetical protein
MRPIAGSLVASVLGVVLTTIALTLTMGYYTEPAGLPTLFLIVAVVAGPAAFYFAFCMRGYLELIEWGAQSLCRVRFAAHLFGLGLGALVLALVLSWHWFLNQNPQDLLWRVLPRAAIATLSGCTGIAWGSVWTLPLRREDA